MNFSVGRAEERPLEDAEILDCLSTLLNGVSNNITSAAELDI